MTSSDPAEAPEHHTGTLSPVSPKPVHYPSPSNIPILELQMDPAYNASSSLTDHESAQQPAENAQPSFSQNGDVVHNVVAVNDQGQGSAQDSYDGNALMNEAEEDGLQNNQNDSGLLADVSHDPSNVLTHGAVETGAFQTPQDLPPAASVPDASVSNVDFGVLTGLNIQQLLDNIAANSAVSRSEDQGPAADISSAQPTPSAPDAMEMVPSELSPALSLATPGHIEAPAQPPLVDGAALPVSTEQLAQIETFPDPSDATALPSTEGAPGTAADIPSPVPPTPSTQVPTQPEPSVTSDVASAPSPIDGRPQPHNIDAKDGENVPWDKETQRKYDAFLDEERQYVLEGQWDRFPMGSRLFIGNLSSEKVTKRDLFHVFHRYGRLAQISIKQAFGFVQFLEAPDCARALHNEQGVSIRGRKVHLEISKPQKSKNSKDNNGAGGEGRASRNRRSKSPDRNGRANNDRNRGGQRRQDSYRPPPSPSPRSPRGRGPADQYRSRRSPDRYDGRRRSRSPTRDHRRSPSSSYPLDDGLPLPRRPPHQIPDLQIIVKDVEWNRNLIEMVKTVFLQRGIRVDELYLQRLDEAAVMRRQIIEGVVAVLRLDLEAQHRQKFHLSVFDRSGGFGNVRFEEYKDMDLNICVELVMRAKQNAAQRPTTDYAMSQYGIPSAKPSPTPGPQGYGMPPQGGPHVPQGTTSPGALGNLDPSSLQRLLQSMNAPQPGLGGPPNPNQMPAQPPSPLLPMGNGMGGGQPMGGLGVQYGQPQAPGIGQRNGLNGGGPAAPTNGGGGSGTDIQSIIAQLGQYRQ